MTSLEGNCSNSFCVMMGYAMQDTWIMIGYMAFLTVEMGETPAMSLQVQDLFSHRILKDA